MALEFVYGAEGFPRALSPNPPDLGRAAAAVFSRPSMVRLAQTKSGGSARTYSLRHLPE